ncbi:hypothetical protein A9Q84_10820 [Halobacteriovorax marinus]|uniref:Aspartoacylase n=1 Tax=Halobacteriovorax marinus TaxID=97084 RepID=A0A1Y5F7H4_9BACT|nr:hypothetical protein A9Q84_10820 [Halobacteriovorax marinus]
MKFAIIGGTHGNEPVGIKVIESLKNNSDHSFRNSFKTFLGNPKAYELGKRYVNSDLNRAFGNDESSLGNEKSRASELQSDIVGKYDFLLDLHTTTSSMGLTVILTHLDEISLKSACYLKKMIPDLKIIVSVRAGKECPYTISMVSSGLTVEVGPVANNVIKAELVIATRKMVDLLLDYDFSEKFDYQTTDCFKTIGIKSLPEGGEWMVHPNIDGHDFMELKNGDPMFINIDGEVLSYEGETIYPLFVNEAAYQENNTAFEFAIKSTLK